MREKKSIRIKGANANNLKNVDVQIPYHQLVVVTGVSGSGKSSLTMDTLYAEGQRRYVESLSSYARQFLMRMKKPEVDQISGLCPAIAIEQRVGNKNARSTVGTLTEVYDYLRVLFARVGHTFSPISGQEVKKQSVTDVIDFLHQLENGQKVLLLAPVLLQGRSLEQSLDLLLQKGYTRLQWEGKTRKIQELLEAELPKTEAVPYLLIDRFVINKDDAENNKRIADSVDSAFQEGLGRCFIDCLDGQLHSFSTRFELDGQSFEEPSPQLFNFNSSLGACPACEGYGKALGIDEEKVIPNKQKSIFEDAVACWRGDKASRWLKKLLKVADKFDFPVHRPYLELNAQQLKDLWEGNKHFAGINGFFEDLESHSYKIQNRVMLARYRGKTVCPACNGTRLRPEALCIKINGYHIGQLVQMPIDQLVEVLDKLELSPQEAEIADRLLEEIKSRLNIMLEVGLSYLSLDRLSASLSGGEIQRIHLTRTLGSNLTSSLYVLDEPSIGLHPRDTDRLIKVLRKLRDLGNTVVVVEHEEDIIAQADYLIDVGPFAGVHGGEIIFAGPYPEIHSSATDSLTAKYMSGRMSIPLPDSRRKPHSFIRLEGAAEHNLKNIDVNFPLHSFSVVTGVSGSGKTTLVKSILYPALLRALGEDSKKKPGAFKALTGDYEQIGQIEMVNQSPIGRSSRSNPVTYVKAYDAIRKLFAKQHTAKMQNFKPKHFSFNVEAGRCESCKGEGETVVSMQFLADVRLICEDCNGQRFQKEVLAVKYNDKSIYDVLEMTVEEALLFFEDQKDIVRKLQPLADVGLGYIRLGQSSSTLSGGEAQRVKLAAFLGKDEGRTPHILFIFDEPTTGLHFHDIKKLLDAFNALVEAGHSVIVIEHNMEVIKSADYIIDLGAEGGKNGGQLLFQGSPEEMLKIKGSYTADFLRTKLKEVMKS